MTNFTGTITLARVAIRRDRLSLSIWVLVITGMAAGMAAAIQGLIETQRDLDEFTGLYVTNPTMRLFGLASESSMGGFTVTRSWIVWAILAALMSSLAVVRHTRQNEDTRCAELISSGVVGRYASLAAALLVVVGANILLATLVALGLIVNGLPAAGSFAAGTSVGGIGIAFAGIGAVSAQLASSGRGANGLSAGALGVTYLFAGIGNMLGNADEAAFRVTSAWPAWLSPIGWGQQMRPYSDADWWIVGLFVAFFAVCTVAALTLIGKRDVGRGMFAERRGPATAARGLLSPLGLAWRLQRGILLGWAAAVAVYGLAIGAVSSEIEGLFEDLEQGQQLIERIGGTDQIIEGFFATVVGLMGSIIAIYTLQVLLRMRAEEEDGTLDAILATSVSRHRWALSWIANAVAGTIILLIVTGLAAGTGSGLSMGDLDGQLAMLMEAAAVQLPATLVIAGIVVAMFGLLPRWAAVASWVIFGVAIFSGPVVGGLLELPGWLRDVSPFSHTPLAPAAEITLTPLVVLTGIAVLFAASGMATFRQRDVARV